MEACSPPPCTGLIATTPPPPAFVTVQAAVVEAPAPHLEGVAFVARVVSATV